MLFGRLGLSRKRRGKTGYSTDARVLQAIRHEHPVIPKIERWRELTKLAQTYLDALPAAASRRTAGSTPRSTRPRPPPAGSPRTTRTSRTSRSGPRWAARSGPASWPRPATCWSRPTTRRSNCGCSPTSRGEDALKEIFRKGEDVHTATACRVFGVTPEQIDPGMRSKSKMINYGIVYGLSAWGMADRLDIPQEEAEEFIAAVHGRVPGGRALDRGDDRAGHRARLRLDPVRSPPPGARAARPPLGDAQAGRALRGQHGHPGHRRRHHEGGDGALRSGAQASRGCARGRSSRSTTSCCSRVRRRRPRRWSESRTEQMGGAFEMDPPLAVEVGVGPDWLAAK